MRRLDDEGIKWWGDTTFYQTAQYWVDSGASCRERPRRCAAVLAGLRAGRFTRPASKLAGAQTGLADTVDLLASKSEWGRNASMKASDSAGRFARHKSITKIMPSSVKIRQSAHIIIIRQDEIVVMQVQEGRIQMLQIFQDVKSREDSP